VPVALLVPPLIYTLWPYRAIIPLRLEVKNKMDAISYLTLAFVLAVGVAVYLWNELAISDNDCDALEAENEQLHAELAATKQRLTESENQRLFHETVVPQAGQTVNAARRAALRESTLANHGLHCN
jgi:hypothetical protein